MKKKIPLIIILILFFMPFSLLAKEKTLHIHNFTLRSSHIEINQGETLSVWVDSKKTLKSLKFWIFKKSFTYHKVKNKTKPHLFRAFIAIPPTENQGDKYITIKAIDTDNITTRMYLKITVKKSDFPTDFIALPKEKKSIVSNKQLIKEATIIGKKFKEQSFKRFVYNNFIWPVTGRISSPFGSQRRYNTGALAWMHKGTDIAAQEGTPVKATNSGKVLISKKMIIHGNTIMIDHGCGVKSIYNHMSKLAVNQGQYVKRGQIIGYVGSTGISTGPHLHFGISVSDIRVNPEQWLKNLVMLH